MRAVLIINPVSGDDVPNAHKVSSIQTFLARGPFVTELRYTTPELSAAQIAQEAVAQGVQVVIVGGGDGTVSEVARELVHKSTILGILPIGTFNNIARSLGIPPDLPLACTIITNGHTREMDVGIANDERYFFEAAGAGLDATLFPIGEEIKGGRWTRVFEAARLTFQYRTTPIDITFDLPLGEALSREQLKHFSPRELAAHTVRRRALLTVVANGPYYGGGYTVAPGARLSDGRLTVSLYRNFSKLELFRHFHSISRGRFHYHPNIETYFAREVRLSSAEALPVHVDGCPFGHLPVTLRAVPRALHVYAPERKRLPDDGNPPVALPAPLDTE